MSLRSPRCHPERAKRVEGSRPRRTVSFPLPTSIYPPCAFEILRRVPLLRMTHSSRARRGRRPRRPQGPAQCLPRARGRWREAPDEVPAKRNPRPTAGAGHRLTTPVTAKAAALKGRRFFVDDSVRGVVPYASATSTSSMRKFSSLPAISWLASKVMVLSSLAAIFTGKGRPYWSCR